MPDPAAPNISDLMQAMRVALNKPEPSVAAAQLYLAELDRQYGEFETAVKELIEAVEMDLLGAQSIRGKLGKQIGRAV